MQGGSRIVLDVTGPWRVEKAFTLAAVDGQPARLVLDLATTDRQSFLRDIGLARPGTKRPFAVSRRRRRAPIRVRSS